MRNKYKYAMNIVADPFKLVFLKLSKNACTSVAIRLAELLEMPKREDFPKFIHQKKYYPFTEVSEESLHSEYQDYLRFAIIRNPWERLVSCYVDKIFPKTEQNEFFLNRNPQFYREMPFEEFVNVVAQTPDHQADAHFCGQLYWLNDLHGNLLADYLASMDDLEKHLVEIESLTGAKLSGLVKHNSTKHREYKEFYTSKELIEKVRQRFWLDVEFFGFEFGEKNNSFPFGKIERAKLEQLMTADLKIGLFKELNREYHFLLQKAEKQTELTTDNLKLANKEIETLSNQVETLRSEIEHLNKKVSQLSKTNEQHLHHLNKLEGTLNDTKKAIAQAPFPLRFLMKKLLPLK